MAGNDWTLLALHDYHLQSLVHGHHDEALRWIHTPTSDAPTLLNWLALHLNLPMSAAQLESMPWPYRCAWHGWNHYYSGKLPSAANTLHEAFESLENRPENQQMLCSTALGLGKVYTRTGHWQAARAWLLYALNVGRNADRQFDILRGYGALGELFLRASHIKAAHACISTSYHLLPPGKGQQAKQLNYLATTLMRSQAHLRSESLLMSARFMASDSHDQDSRLHALARLQFLRWDKYGADNGHILDELAETLPTHPTPVATGFLFLGQALRAWPLTATADSATVVQSLKHAREYFGSALPMEQAWADLLRHQLEGKAYEPCAIVRDCLSLHPHLPPPDTVVLDKTWQHLPLLTENGFAWLEKTYSPDGMAAIRQQRQCFFI